MPGLKELANFRRELSDLAHEREVVAERGEVYEELPMPPSASVPQMDVDNFLAGLGDTAVSAESAPIKIPMVDIPATEFSGFDTSFPEAPPSDLPSPDDLSGFDDLLSSLSLDEPVKPAEDPELSAFGDLGEIAQPAELGDFSEPAELDEPAELGEIPGVGEPTQFDFPGNTLDNLNPPEEDSYNVPEDLLSGFASDIEEIRAETGTEPETTTLDESFSMPDFDFDVTEKTESTGPEEIQEMEALEEFADFEESSPVPLSGIEADLPELGEMDFTPSFEMEEPLSAIPGSGSALPDVFGDGMDFSAPSSLPEEVPPNEVPRGPSAPDSNPFGEDFSDFSVPDDLNIVDTAPKEEGSGDLDGFDGFSLDADFLKGNQNQAASEADEFHIPGFSDFTSGEALPSYSEIPASTGGAKRSPKKEIPLNISDDEFRRFLEQLASYPLNLRIAIEEYLSGEAGTEFHKMELVHHILNNVPIRKIAHSLETSLDRLIPIPRDYEKKTVAEYEKEKSSLKYVFFNRILPAAVLFIIASVLAFCTAYLSYQFIYKPIAAENLYQRGYNAIQDANYSQSFILFDKAVQIWNKKNWYFKYARAFRDKKQFISAEIMYVRILDRFKNDKAAGLEYAEMLRTDLRNFEKAETILKRRLLEFYINDKDGLMLLGDNYLDWAEENPAKFEEARKTYASLIQLYGPQDQFLAGMMRFFIRTDKLAQVLPLKDHFMGKKAKIGARDLVELSGYLLEKRYNPQPGESESLRNQIEDLRALLERALKADQSSPEAHYNLGRFMIYNYKYDQAAVSINAALQRFEEVTTMSPKRVLSRIDAFRLSGELLAENMEYLKAQSRYTEGITLYEKQKANRTVRPDTRVGKLYADYADIDYFISGDLSSALVNYTRATEELNDTPSIRYRIGYINFQQKNYEEAMNEFNRIQAKATGDKNLLYGFGNALYRREDYYAAQGCYEHLLEILEAERLRKGIVFPQIRPDHQIFVEEYMHAANNLGVTLGRLAYRTGDSRKNAEALALLSESIRAWDALTRNPETLVRVQGSNLAFLNIQNMTHPQSTFVPEIYADIPKTLENEKVLQQQVDQ